MFVTLDMFGVLGMFGVLETLEMFGAASRAHNTAEPRQ